MSGVTCWFRPTFDLPIPPIYQPSTIETVARDRSPRLGKTGNSDFGNPKKMGETMSNSAEIYIYQSLSKLEVTLFLRTSKFLKTKYLDEVSFWGRFTESWKTVYMQHLLARVSSHAKNRRPIACQNWHCCRGGCFFLWCHAINFHSTAFFSHRPCGIGREALKHYEQNPHGVLGAHLLGFSFYMGNNPGRCYFFRSQKQLMFNINGRSKRLNTVHGKHPKQPPHMSKTLKIMG